MTKPFFEVLRSLLVFGRVSTWVESCPDGVSQHSVPLQWAQNVCSHGLIHWKWQEY